MAAGDLTTVLKVKSFLGIENTTDDAKLADLVTRCSAAIATFLSRAIATTTFTEKYDGNGSDVLMLRNYPLASVSSLTVDGAAVTASADGLTNYGFGLGDTYIFFVGGVFPRGRRNVAITYSAGFSSVPTDIEQACIEMVADRYKLPSRIGEKSKALPQGGSVSYDTEHMSAKVRGLLNPYKRVLPV